METSPYLYNENVGPWDHQSPIKKSTLEDFYRKNSNIDTSKRNSLPKSNMSSKPIEISRVNNSKSKLKKNILNEKGEKVIKNEGNLSEKCFQRNFLNPRKKTFKTIHIRELQKKLQLINTEESFSNNQLMNQDKQDSLIQKTLPILNISGTNPSKNLESPTKKIVKNLEYFTPNVSNIKQRVSNVNSYKQLLLHEKTFDTRFREDMYIKGNVINIDKNKTPRIFPGSLHIGKNENSYGFPQIKKQIEHTKTVNLRDESIKRKIDDLKKIQKKSTHFLKYFLLKYDEDVLKKKKFMNIKNF